MEQIVLQGHKGGGSSPHEPVEARNNLLSKSYAKVLLAIGEGEFAGTPTGQEIYLDGTPLINANGVENFGGVKWTYRSGTVDQTHIPGMPDVSVEYPLNFALTDLTAYTRLVSDPQLDAIRVTLAWPALFQQKDNGDIVGYNIVYAIDISTNGGAFIPQGQWDTSSGKTNVEYNRTHRLNLPKPGTTWTVRVRRITPNQNNGKFQDNMMVKAFAEVIDARLRYPNTALLYVEFDAELFGGTSIPKISIKTKGRLVQVPSNYEPSTRMYSGVWNGAFKWAWSDNPAWAFYDLVVNERFGLGARIKPSMVDKWTLYQVAQYCDVMVPNGKGGTEPRYTCNIYIQSRKEAWQVLRDVVAIFNGMLHWNGTQMVASADMPVAVNTVRTYNRSNVINGKFSYGSTSEKTIYTTALVSFDDPENHYETAVEAVNDLNLVQRYKTWAQAELSAIGVTSRGQAQRKGKYTMLTNSLNRVVTFKLGLEGYLPKPGEVIGIADQVLAGVNLSGRISTATLNTVTLDRIPNAVAGDILYVNKADGIAAEGRTIQSVNGKVVTVTTNYSSTPVSELGWYVEKTTLKSQLYRITKVVWSDDEGQYEVTGVQYEDTKYAAVDIGARLESRPITTIPPGGQDAPTNVIVSSFTYLEQTMAVTTLSVKWTRAAGAMNYEGQWRKDGGDWNNVGLTAGHGFDVKGIYKGAYQARVRAINAVGAKSLWAESDNTQLDGKVGGVPALTTLTTVSEIFGIRLNWTFAAGAEDGAFIQLQQANDNIGTAASELSYVAYPAQTYLKSNMLGGVAQYFRGRLIDRTGNQSPWSPWTYGISEYGTDKILESIAGEIGRTELGQQLIAELDQSKLDLGWMEAEISGLEQQVRNDVAELNDTVYDLQGQLQGIISSPEYDATKVYASGDIVRVGTRLYQATQAVPVNSSPPNVTYWLDVGQVVEDLTGLAAQVQVNTASITTVNGTLTSQAQQLSGLDSRLTSTETTNTGQATAINNLQTSVTQQGNTITSQGNSITALSSDVDSLETATTANATAISGLQTTVTQQGNTITTQGSSITSIQTSISGLQAAGTNLLVDTYSWLTSVALPVTVSGTSMLRVGVAVAEATSGFGMKMTTASTSAAQFIMLSPTNNAAGWNVDMEAGTYLVSMYVQGSVAGTMRISMYNGTHRYSPTLAFTTTRTRLTFVITNSVYARCAVTIYSNMSTLAAGVDITVDSVMVERVAGTGTSTTPSPFVAGNSAASVSANVSTVAALSNTVTQQGTTLTAQGNAITSLNASLGSIDGVTQENLVVDPTFKIGAGALTSAAGVTVVPRTDVSVPPNTATTRVLKWDVPVQATNNTYVGWGPIGQQLVSGSTTLIAMAPGDVYEVSCDVYMDVAGGARQHGIWFQMYDAAGASISHQWITGAISTNNSVWERLSGSITIPATVVSGRPTFRVSAGSATAVWVSNMRWTKQTASQAASAAAITSLTTTVNNIDGEIDAVSKEVRSLFAQSRQDDGSGDLSDALKMWQNTAAIQTERVARADKDGSFAQDMTTVSASASQAQSLANGAQGTADAALNAANTVSATVQTVSTAVATLNGKVAASYSIKLAVTADGRYYGAGMGIGIENTPAGMQSQVLFLADRFAIMNAASGQTTVPFVVQGGQTIINNAMIGTAAITNAMIADAQITYAKIGAAQIADTHIINGHITNAKIGDAAVSTAKIQDLSVNTLKIAGRAVTVPIAVYSEGVVGCPGAINTPNYTAVQGITVSSGGDVGLFCFTCQLSMNTSAGYWRVRRSDGAILASGRMAGDNFNFNTPAKSFAITFHHYFAGTLAFWLDIAPWFSNVSFGTMYVDNRAITYTSFMR